MRKVIHIKRLFLYLIMFICVLLVVAGGVLCVKYSKVNKLCDQIRSGVPIDEEIDESLANGLTAPLFLDRFFTITQLDEVRSPLVEACYCGNLQAVEVLLKNGADPNVYIRGYWTPIEAVVVVGPFTETRFAIMKLLVEYGADVNLYASFEPVVFEMASRSYTGHVNEAVLYLLDHGALRQTEDDCTSVLIYAAMKANSQLVEALIDNYSFDVNQKGFKQRTPLVALAASERKFYTEDDYICTIKVLLEHGADKSMVDENGKTAYDYAVEKDSTEIADLLKP